ncbi:multicopper oxidase family protein [Bacillus sp. CHD6a]|uniref:multicopper oxidase family protein n=1 Tax=Bacillus sp. CHD6a TaxID=1643452 RepID=UPI0006CD55DB|nr:multicopper oxidase [Bacillus sp. CHD6a]KPB05430.1 copper oxidase [Bacillus sp. CHD6a]
MLEKFVDPLPIMKTIQPICILNQVPYYEINMVQSLKKLHRDLPPTKIWGYNGEFPGPTFRVWKNRPIHVLWKNELPLKHFLPIDTTIHGAEKNKPEVRTVVHLHGGVTPDTSDGYPEAWFTRGFKQVGSYFTNQLYTYPNIQDATALWYHDHAMGITRLNIYAGLVGFYLIYDEEEQRLNLPKQPYEIPLLILDRSFQADGALYYPAQPDPPNPEMNPSVLPDFFGDTILVNGKIWPYLDVEPRLYRFRILNGSNSRFYRLSFSNGMPFIQIGSDQGLLAHPVEVPSLLLAPAERGDVLVDFSSSSGELITIRNDAESPFPQGERPNPETTGSIMQIRVIKKLKDQDIGSLPFRLKYIPNLKESPNKKIRNLLLSTRPDQYGRSIHLLDDRLWMDPITETPTLWSTEIWSFINVTNATHPIHLHLVRFQILDRQPFDGELYEKEKKIVPTGPRQPPDTNEQGWKDTVRANPKEITRIIVPFAPFSGLYVWHCHILEHEDYEMMRPYYVLPR